MADTERPKRLRGAKLLEEGYRAGYADGLIEGKKQAFAQIDLDTRAVKAAEASLYYGLDRLKTTVKAQPKRTRRGKAAEPADPALMDSLRASVEQRR